MGPLFREEALAERRHLIGEVSLAVPLKARWFFSLLVTVFLAVVGALLFVRIPTTTRAVGWVLPDKNFVRIRSQSDWIITQVFVQEGQHVTRGTPLFEAKEMALLSGDTIARQSNLRNLGVQLDLAKSMRAATTERLQNEVARLDDEIVQLRGEARFKRDQAALAGRRAQLAQDSFKDASKLAEKGYISRLELRKREDEEIQIRTRQVELSEQIESLKSSIRQKMIGRRVLVASARGQISALGQEVVSGEQRLLFAKNAELATMRAPRSGVVTALQVEPGQASSQNTYLLSISSAGEISAAEVFVPSRAIGKVKVGQDVRLQYDAFPHSVYGYGKGRIMSISAAPIAPQDTAFAKTLADPAYRVMVRKTFDPPSLKDRVALRPGMTLSAVIVLDRQRLWRVLFTKQSS